MVQRLYELKRTPISYNQFSLLIEMCDYFFPGYFFLDSNEQDQMFIAYQENEKSKVEAMSWLEMCIFDLPLKLEELTGKAKEFILEEWLYNKSEEHVVNYLYSIYKAKS
jgi:hypothetical protein